MNTGDNPNPEGEGAEQQPAFTVSESTDRQPEQYTYVEEDAPKEETEHNPEEEIATSTTNTATVDTVGEEVEEVEEVEEEVEEVEEEEQEEYVELDVDYAFKFLKEKKGFEFESIDDLLTPKEQKKYAPQLEKFQEFIENTGNDNFNDFLQTQKDWSGSKPEEVLRELIKAENPELSQKEIDFLYDKKYSIDGLDEELDEDLITERGINSKIDFKKAQEFLEKRKSEYMVDRGSDAHIPEEYRDAKALVESLEQQQKEGEIARESLRGDYVSKTENIFTDDFEGFKLKFGNEKTGYEELSIKPENIQQTKSVQMDVSNFNKKFFDDKGVLTDPNGFHKALYFGSNPDKVAEHFFNLGKAKAEEINDKLSKNIDNDSMRSVNNTGAPAYTVSESKS